MESYATKKPISIRRLLEVHLAAQVRHGPAEGEDEVRGFSVDGVGAVDEEDLESWSAVAGCAVARRVSRDVSR